MASRSSLSVCTAALPLRVAAQCATAARVAEFLAAHPAIERVHYPGLVQHPGHAIAKRQMRLFGAMLSVELKGGEAAAIAVAARARLFTRATSLGGVESLIEHRASMEGPGTQTPANLLRLSIGLEHADDLIADLVQALGLEPLFVRPWRGAGGGPSRRLVKPR